MSGSLLSPFPVGNNPQQPYAYSETYIPDQLIAGNLKLVTENVTIGGTTPLQRGSLLGQQTEGAAVGAGGKTFASGGLIVAAVPNPGDTVTIAGTPITFVTANPTGNQVMIGGPGPDGNPPVPPTAAGTTTALLNFLMGSTDPNLIKLTYSEIGPTNLSLTSATIGTAGNALTLATSNAAAFTVSGPNLTGGTANAGAETITGISLGTNAKVGNYIVTLTSAVAFNVEDPGGAMLPAGVVGTPYTDPQINFTINTGAGIAAGDTFQIASSLASNAYVLATGAATDGSQRPVAILADYSVANNTISGVYIMGEFNINAVIFGPGINPQAAKNALHIYSIYLKSAVTAVDPS